jgi:uncharacterized membrane protein
LSAVYFLGIFNAYVWAWAYGNIADFFVLVLLLIPIVIVVFIVYIFLKAGDNRVKTLESRVDQLEKEKIMNEHVNSLEKRFDEIQKK